MATNLIDGATDIQVGTIGDASISHSASIALSKLANYVKLVLSDGTVAMGANLSLASYLINNLGSGVASSDAVNLGQVESLISTAIAAATPVAFAGAYASGTAYTVNQLVSYGGNLYICILAGTGEEPDVSPLYWTLVVPGVTGATGATGVRGSLIYVAAGAPGTITGQLNGDVYINSTNGELYSLVSGTWTAEYTLTGGGTTYTASSPISINGSHVISAAAATASSLGVVQVGTNIYLSAPGVIAVATGATGTLGVLKPDNTSITAVGGTISAFEGGVGGDISGYLPDPTVSGIKGYPVTNTTPVTGAQLIYISGSGYTLCEGGYSPTSYIGSPGSWSIGVATYMNYYGGAGTATLTLPASPVQGKRFLIKNISSYAVTVGAGSGNTIDGASTYSLPTQYSWVEVVMGGSGYMVIGAGTV